MYGKMNITTSTGEYGISTSHNHKLEVAKVATNEDNACMYMCVYVRVYVFRPTCGRSQELYGS